MTTKTQVVDNTYRISGPYGPFTVGSYFSKKQVGGSSPKLKLDMPYTSSVYIRNDNSIDRTTIAPAAGSKPETIRGAGGMEWWGYGAGFAPNVPTTWTTDDEYRLLAKLTAKIRDHQFNAAVFGAEARESFNMITESATRISAAMRYVKRGDLSRAARVLGARKPGKVRKDVGSNWLELQYGWLPLLGDVHSAGEALASILNQPQRTEFRQRRKRDIGINPTQAFNSGSAFVQKQVVAKMTEDYSKISALGLDDPLTVAWELLPYSFVADWFLPIGDFLEYRQVMGKTKATFIVTEVTKLVVQGGTGGKLSDGTLVIVEGGSTYRVNQVNMVRRVASTYQVPLPSFQNPLDLSWKRCVSAIALVQQRFR